MNLEKLKKKYLQRQEERQNLAQQRRRHIQQKGQLIFENYHFQEVILFGSIQQGHCSLHSDVDLFVCPLAPEDYWQCKQDLEEVMDLPVDLLTQDSDPLFIQRIREQGAVIYEA